MAERHPLIRVPTEPMRLTLFVLFAVFGLFLGIIGGFAIGYRHFGIVGGIIGAIVGGFLGLIIGKLPDFLMSEFTFRQMQRSSNEQLKARLEESQWSFYQVLALLNLLARKEDVQPYLPRVLARLESPDYFQRVFARDVLRWGFTPLAVQLDKLGYDPVKPVEECRGKIAQLRELQISKDG